MMWIMDPLALKWRTDCAEIDPVSTTTRTPPPNSGDPSVSRTANSNAGIDLIAVDLQLDLVFPVEFPRKLPIGQNKLFVVTSA